MITLGTILYVALLLVNAMAILNEDRFLAKIGWTTQAQQVAAQQQFTQSYDPYSGTPQQDVGVKVKFVNLIGAVRTLMRVPLIFVNVAVIIYELILGS